jgi:hypothetical protein
MKYVLLSIFLSPLFLSAQDATATGCKLVKETDPYTRETKLSSGFISLQGASLTIDADNKEIDFFFAVPDKCFADASTVFIFFEGSKIKTTYRNSGSMNCDGYFHFVFKNGITTPTVLKKLASQKVANFIFTGTDGKATIVSLLPDQQKSLMEITACMIDESQALIKK